MSTSELESEVSAAELRDIVGRYATGVVIVTTHDDEPVGMTANSFTWISMQPATVLVCINRSNRAYDSILRAGSYAVSILGGSQGWIAQTFAVPGRSQAERFAQVLAKVALTGSPVLAEASAWLDCRLIEVVEVGTHGVFVARVVAAGSDNWHEEPLVYHQHAMFPLGEADQ